MLSKGDIRGVVCYKGGRRDTPSRTTRPRAVAWAGGRAVGRSVGRSRARACDSSWWPPSGHWLVADLILELGCERTCVAVTRGSNEGKRDSQRRDERERRTRRRGATGARRRPPFDWARRGRTSTAPAVDSFTEHREAVLEPVSGRERGRLARCGLVDGSCSETRIVRVDHRRRRCSVRSIDLRCANVTLDRCANRTLTSVRLARARRRRRGSGP